MEKAQKRKERMNGSQERRIINKKDKKRSDRIGRRGRTAGEMRGKEKRGIRWGRRKI